MDDPTVYPVPMSEARFLVSPAELKRPQVVLSGAELRHLRVRRIRPGEFVWVTDGQGNERRGRVLLVERARAVIEFTVQETLCRESPLAVTLCLALIQPAAVEFVVQKATELGATRFVLFRASRSVSGASAVRVSRWQRVAAEATKQCQRAVVPSLVAVESLEAAISPLEAQLRIALAPESGSSIADLAERPPESVAIVVGPEGGFSPKELAALEATNVRRACLGPRILRSETAAIAALSVVQYLWGDLRWPAATL